MTVTASDLKVALEGNIEAQARLRRAEAQAMGEMNARAGVLPGQIEHIQRVRSGHIVFRISGVDRPIRTERPVTLAEFADQLCGHVRANFISFVWDEGGTP